ncbi:hypothetical protein Pcinc_038589, partial [Petrolisthes cinctipes]
MECNLPFLGQPHIGDLDSDELMERIRLAMKEKERMEREKERKILELDHWKQILSSASSTAVSEVSENSEVSEKFSALLSSDMCEILAEFHTLSHQIQTLRFLEGVSANVTKEDNNLFIKFIRPESS